MRINLWNEETLHFENWVIRLLNDPCYLMHSEVIGDFLEDLKFLYEAKEETNWNVKYQSNIYVFIFLFETSSKLFFFRTSFLGFSKFLFLRQWTNNDQQKRTIVSSLPVFRYRNVNLCFLSVILEHHLRIDGEVTMIESSRKSRQMIISQIQFFMYCFHMCESIVQDRYFRSQWLNFILNKPSLDFW